MNRFSLFAVILLAFGACGNQSYTTAEYAAADNMVANGVMEAEIALMEPSEKSVVPTGQKVIKEGYVSFESDDLAATRQHIDSILRQLKGYVASEREYSTSDRISQSLTARIPAPHFDEFVDALGKVAGSFDDKSISSRDVTAEYIDIVARTKTKKELEQRYLELLQRANSVTEVLEIEKELGNIRADIESMEGRIRYLSDQTDYSTLQLTYYKTVPGKTAFGSKFARGFVNGWNNMVWFLVGLVNIWPFVILIPVAVFFTGRWWRRRREKRRASNP